MSEVLNEHENKRMLSEDIFYPDHDQRTESPTFLETKRKGHALGLRCAISGTRLDVEYHHAFCEWAFAGGVDWHTVKGIALGTIKELPVLDLVTDQPTAEMAPVEGFLIYLICEYFKYKGFDWEAFDPDKPETLVDSLEAMIILNKKFHRGKDHGAHSITGPIHFFQAFPRKLGFIFSPDEMIKAHQ